MTPRPSPPAKYNIKQDGIHILNIGKTWEKIVLAARIIVAIENPQASNKYAGGKKTSWPKPKKSTCVYPYEHFGCGGCVRVPSYLEKVTPEANYFRGECSASITRRTKWLVVGVMYAALFRDKGLL